MKSFFRLFILFLLFFNIKLYTQQSIADSLTRQLKLLSGERKVDALNKLADIYNYINNKSAIEYAERGLELAKSIGYERGISESYGSLGYCYINVDNQKAVDFTNKALEIRQRLNLKTGIGNSLNVLGIINYYSGNYLASVDNHLKSLKVREELGDEEGISASYNNIALVYLSLNSYDNALEYLKKSLDICIKRNDKTGIAIVKDNIGDIYAKMGKYDKAFECFNDALKINKETGNRKSEAYSYYNIGSTYRKSGDTLNAFKFYRLSLKNYNELEDRNGIADVENGIASIYEKQGLIAPALLHAQTALKNAQPINSQENISIAAGILKNGYEKLGDYRKAYYYFTLFHNSSDSIKSVEKIKKLTKLEFDYRLEKIKKEQEAELNRQKIFVRYLSITLFLSLIIVMLIILGYVSKRKMNKKLNELNSKLQELNEAKDRFFSIIAHDLRGPFQALLSVTELLASESESLKKEEIRSLSEGLSISLQNQYQLLNDLLDWSRLQTGRLTINKVQIALHNEFCKIIKPLELCASQKNIKVLNSIDEDIIVNADANMLCLVMRNLISNSIKFSRANGQIRVCAFQRGDIIEIKVEDNGTGIEEEDLKKLFRIDIHHSTKGTANEIGTGLGLILCREIIEKHSGSISVESKVNKGTSVTLRIPLK
ncbi:MAG: tetratricopeptide repeat protein [Bacillota bacterium]